MEDANIISISDLIQLSRPLTGKASSKKSSSPNPSNHALKLDSRVSSIKKRKIQSVDEPSTSNSTNLIGFPVFTDNHGRNPRILGSLNRPALITGTVNLWSNVSVRHSCSLKNDCFLFTDGSASVCCAVLDLDVKIIGKRIHVIAWNFIPAGCSGGFLEIIEWKIFEEISGPVRDNLNLDPYPLHLSQHGNSLPDNSRKARAIVCGILNSVSPVLVVPGSVPCRNSVSKESRSNQLAIGQSSDDILIPVPTKGKEESCKNLETESLTGFLVELTVCDCIKCSKDASGVPLCDLSIDQNCHSFIKPVFLYLCGSSVTWRPVFSKLIGKIVSITGLKKKLVHVGEDELYLMFLTTERTVLYQQWEAPNVSSLYSIGNLAKNKLDVKASSPGRCLSGLYVGIVTGIFMQGMVVELDREVWLIVTDKLLVPAHSLRVGALLSLRNVHFVVPKFSWAKMLLLGACSKTNMDVKSFSPLGTQCHSRSQMHSLLGKFIESLTFSARFWVLLTVSCFRKKFAGIFSEKEILGAKKIEGLAQIYASSCLSSCAFRHRHGVFKEYCEHDCCCCKEEPKSGPLKLAVPLANFISNSVSIWVASLSQTQKDIEMMGNKSCANLPSCEGESYGRSIRKIISGKDLGIVLLGTLQISPSSGLLQLVDATGCVDVVIPDLLSTVGVQGIYEINDYKLVVEGFPLQASSLGLDTMESFSCRNIFHRVPPRIMLNGLALYVHFYLRNATFINFPPHLLSCMDKTNDLEGSRDGTFHLLQVTHKFPAIQNFRDDRIVSNNRSFFAEALFLPYDLYLPRKNGVSTINRVPRDKLEEQNENADGENSPEKACSKGPEVVCSSGSALISGSEEEQKEAVNLGSPLEISCSLTFRSPNNRESFVAPGILFWADSNVKERTDERPSACKVLLEFKSETFTKYQMLRIGFYYILRHTIGKMLCNATDRSGYVGHDTVLVTSQTLLWNLSLSSSGDMHQSRQEFSAINGLLLENPEATFGDLPNNELLFQSCLSQVPVTYSDVNLHLSTEAISFMKQEVESVQDGLIRPFTALREVVNVSTCIQSMISAPLRASCTPNLGCNLPEGKLISLYGEVAAVHSLNCNSVDARKHQSCETLGSIYESRLTKDTLSSTCIHVYEGYHMVKVRGSLNKLTYPIGMGPGVFATFHRLLLGDSNNGRELRLTPVSFIVIKSIREVDYCYIDRHSLPVPTSDNLNEGFLSTFSSGSISQLIQCLEPKPIMLHGRVVAVHVLVFENHTHKYEKPRQRAQSMMPAVTIPLAGFIFDDGSASCCCWASAQRAATLLRLHEITARTFGSNYCRPRMTRRNKLRKTVGYLLKEMLKKHHRVSVKNQGATLDSSCQDYTFSVHSNEVLSKSDEILLKLIILNACCGSVISVAGSIMDVNGLGLIEKELMDMQVTVQAGENIWAREVGYMNPLAEARSILQELTG